MQTIQAADFKINCLTLVDEVTRTGEVIIITKDGKPVAELRPVVAETRPSPFGLHRGMIEIKGDIMSPIDVEWDALK